MYILDRLEDKSEIQHRKIYKAKRLTRPGDPQGNKPEIKGKFKLLGSLTSNPAPTIKKVEDPKPVAKKDSPKAVPNTQSQTQSKPEQKQATLPTKASESVPSPAPKTIFDVKVGGSKSVFVNKPDPEAAKNLVSVFGAPKAPSKSTNIFAPKSTDTEKKDVKIFNKIEDKQPVNPTPKVEDKKPFGLFGKAPEANTTGIFGKVENKSTNLFGKKDEKIEPKIAKVEEKAQLATPKVSLFGSSTIKSTGIFGAKETKVDQIKPLEVIAKEVPKNEEPKKTSLFGGTSSQSGCKYLSSPFVTYLYSNIRTTKANRRS